MPIVLDTATKASYDALSLASARASAVVSALTGTVVCEVYDGLDVLRASGTMGSPWATASGATITVGEVTGLGVSVTSGGTPDANWYCQFRSGTRFVRGTFGLLGSGRDFVWSLASFQTGSRGVLGSVAFTAIGTAAPSVAVVPTISGAAQVGAVLSCSTGTWDGVGPITFAYQWRRNGVAISGATASTYVVVGADLSTTVSCLVTASNAAGSNSVAAGGILITAGAGDPSGLPLVQSTNMVYAGAFRVPEMTAVQPFADGNAYIGTLAFDDSTKRIFLGGHAGANGVGEITIPASLSTTAVSFFSLPTGNVQQPFFRADQNVLNIYGNDPATAGLLVVGSDLVFNRNVNYPGSLPEYTTIRRSKTLTTATTPTPKRFSVNGDAANFRRYVAGYMCHVPPEWQSALGGSAISGFVGLSINGSTSVGPAAFAFNPDDLLSGDTISATPLVYYQMTSGRRLSFLDFPDITQAERATIADGLWNDTASIGGCLIPNGTRSLLFFGKVGYGPYDYGTNSGGEGPAAGEGYVPSRRAAGFTPDRPIYDPAEFPGPGERAYPYRYQAWAYDLNDFAQVVVGSRNPWSVTPYASWTFPLLYESQGSLLYNKSTPDPDPDLHTITGACYDKSTRRIYLSTIRGSNGRAIVHALIVNNATVV